MLQVDDQQSEGAIPEEVQERVRRLKEVEESGNQDLHDRLRSGLLDEDAFDKYVELKLSRREPMNEGPPEIGEAGKRALADASARIDANFAQGMRDILMSTGNPLPAPVWVKPASVSCTEVPPMPMASPNWLNKNPGGNTCRTAGTSGPDTAGLWDQIWAHGSWDPAAKAYVLGSSWSQVGATWRFDVPYTSFPDWGRVRFIPEIEINGSIDLWAKATFDTYAESQVRLEIVCVAQCAGPIKGWNGRSGTMFSWKAASSGSTSVKKDVQYPGGGLVPGHDPFVELDVFGSGGNVANVTVWVVPLIRMFADSTCPWPYNGAKAYAGFHSYDFSSAWSGIKIPLLRVQTTKEYKGGIVHLAQHFPPQGLADQLSMTIQPGLLPEEA